MVYKTEKNKTDKSTEEKIKNAARELFLQKGFSSTKTRDIAERSGINLALLNYYFRSKKKLFDIIMLETMHGFFESTAVVFNNEKNSLQEKIEIFVASYVDLLLINPEIPLFIMNELKANPNELMKNVGMKDVIMGSAFFKQFQGEMKKGSIKNIHPAHFLMNIMGLTVFPFMANPVIKGMTDLSQKEFEKLMRERKALVPVWIMSILKTNNS
jgi:AcrR family transcriptional regulator